MGVQIILWNNSARELRSGNFPRALETAKQSAKKSVRSDAIVEWLVEKFERDEVQATYSRSGRKP